MITSLYFLYTTSCPQCWSFQFQLLSLRKTKMQLAWLDFSKGSFFTHRFFLPQAILTSQAVIKGSILMVPWLFFCWSMNDCTQRLLSLLKSPAKLLTLFWSIKITRRRTFQSFPSIKIRSPSFIRKTYPFQQDQIRFHCHRLTKRNHFPSTVQENYRLPIFCSVYEFLTHSDKIFQW